jgi:hypothetical protein
VFPDVPKKLERLSKYYLFLKCGPLSLFACLCLPRCPVTLLRPALERVAPRGTNRREEGGTRIRTKSATSTTSIRHTALISCAMPATKRSNAYVCSYFCALLRTDMFTRVHRPSRSVRVSRMLSRSRLHCHLHCAPLPLLHLPPHLPILIRSVRTNK